MSDRTTSLSSLINIQQLSYHHQKGNRVVLAESLHQDNQDLQVGTQVWQRDNQVKQQDNQVQLKDNQGRQVESQDLQVDSHHTKGKISIVVLNYPENIILIHT